MASTYQELLAEVKAGSKLDKASLPRITRICENLVKDLEGIKLTNDDKVRKLIAAKFEEEGIDVWTIKGFKFAEQEKIIATCVLGNLDGAYKLMFEWFEPYGVLIYFKKI